MAHSTRPGTLFRSIRMEDRMPYPFARQDGEKPKRIPSAKGQALEPQRRLYAAKPRQPGRIGLETQTRLFQEVEAARDRIARMMVRYPEITGSIIPTLTEKTRFRLFTKTAEWALVFEDLLLTQCACAGPTSSSGSWSAASREMFRIFDLGDAEMERFVAALENCIERIEQEAGASSIEMKEDLAFLHRALSDLHSAKKAAVEANIRLVIRIARKYFHPEMPFEDLVQEGNLGLMRAVDKFDYRRGYKFSTYASWWIKQAIARALYAHGHIIRLPLRLVQKAAKAKRSSSKRLLETGTSPPTEEIAREAGISPLKLNSILQAMRRRLIPIETPVMEGKAEMGDFIADPSSVSPEDAMIHEDMNTTLRSLLETLGPREKLILEKRFGIGGEEEQSLRELAGEFGLTPERIRQIEKKALEKIKRRLSALEPPSVQ
jgi:RNA polymerase sigma factor (sigma-70 family)